MNGLLLVAVLFYGALTTILAGATMSAIQHSMRTTTYFFAGLLEVVFLVGAFLITLSFG